MSKTIEFYQSKSKFKFKIENWLRPTIKGIVNTQNYFKHIKTNFVRASHAMQHFCKQYDIPTDQRLTIYKSVVRSRLEYAAQVIFFDDIQIQQFEALQLVCLRQLLELPYSCFDPMVLLSTNILPLKHRFYELKINFFIKLKWYTDSLASKVLFRLMDQPLTLKPDANTADSYKHLIQTVIRCYGKSFFNAIYPRTHVLTPELIRPIIKMKIRQFAQILLRQSLPSASNAAIIFRTLGCALPIDQFLNQLPTDTEFIHTFDTLVNDVSLPRLHKPFISYPHLPNAIYAQLHTIWLMILSNLDYVSDNAHTCSRCHDTTSNIFYHQTFVCDSHSLIRHEIFTHISQILLSILPSYRCTLHDKLTDWFQDDIALTIQDSHDILALFIVNTDRIPNSLFKYCQTMFINLIALTNDRISRHLQPLQWYTAERNLKVDLMDHIQAKEILIGTYNETLRLIHSNDINYTNHQLQHFGSSRERRHNPKLKLAATEYVNSMANQYLNDTIIWTDGSVHRTHPIRAGSAFVVSHKNQHQYSASLRIDTSSIAIAELCGIAHSLLWIAHKQPQLSHNIHLMADNQYAINVCQSICKTNPAHSMLVNQINQLLSTLKSSYSIHFHWIPGHTDNKLHSFTDSLANKAALSSRQQINYDSSISMFTDAVPSGWEWPSP